MRLGSFLGRDHGRKFKARVGAATTRIDEHRKELELLRGKLEARRRGLFSSILSAVRQGDNAKASIFGGEHGELREVIRVVSLSELALTQVLIRLQSIEDINDVIRHVNSAFKLMQGVSASAHDTLPALLSATQHVESALAVTMQELGQLSPGLNVDLGAQETEEIVRRAKQYAEEKAQEIAGALPTSLWAGSGETVVDRAEELAPLLKPRDTMREKRQPSEARARSPSAEEDVYNYAIQRSEEIDVLDASASLQLPVEVVEEALLRLVSTGRLRAPRAKEPVH